MNRKQKSVLIRIIAAAVLTVLIRAVPPLYALGRFLFPIPYLIAGYDILLKAVKGIIRLKPFDENFLMAAATVGAFILGEYLECVSVMLLYQAGELFQSIAVGKSRRSITELMDIRPDYANVRDEKGELIKVSPDTVAVGTETVVLPGEKIAIDGIVTSGESSLDASAITGESVPFDVREGSEVSSGCINQSGVLTIRTTREFGQSTVSKVLELMEDASGKKSRSENFIAKFARIYTPAVCISALLLALLPPLARTVFTELDPNWTEWIYRALTFLVISCPCAMVISIPLTFFASIGGAGRAGILIKGSNYIESLSKVGYILFDKTGTMTKGVFEVNGIHHNTIDAGKLLEYAALAECYSNHPISKSLRKAYDKPCDRERVSDVSEVSGEGITARIDGNEVAVGNDKLMERLGVGCIDCRSVGTVVHVAINGEYAGHILISDIIKQNAAKAVKNLYDCGVKKAVMLTGDAEKVGRSVASELGLSEVYCELLPHEKVEITEKLISEKSGPEKLAFAGDGVNDAPVLMRADVGIAMGALGSDAAIEAADVVLMDDDPEKIAKAIRIAKKCMRIVYENIGFSISVKLICLLLGALGYANLWAAIFADVGVMIIAVLNALRALSVKNV